MDADSFRRVIRDFADTRGDLELKGNELLLRSQDKVWVAKVDRDGSGRLIVHEDGQQPMYAEKWISRRLARLDVLAEKLGTFLDECEDFVDPTAEFLNHINEDPDEQLLTVKSSIKKLNQLLNERLPFQTSVVYLTSDAGEGKTTLIEQFSREQARRFRDEKSDWLMVPISLGGRVFLRFDDVTVGALANRLHFPQLSYDTFMELVRLGNIVPAYDGFEEVFVEDPQGDAVSALGTLLSRLRGMGTVVISARKAYFEHESLRARSRLLTHMQDAPVSFCRLSLNRWGKEQFVAYASGRGVNEPEAIYGHLVDKLGPEHPLVTRAVLVTKLLDMAQDSPTDIPWLDRICAVDADSTDMLENFVSVLIEREAFAKWIDRAGAVAKPLIAVKEHVTLLSRVAMEMWEMRTEQLPEDAFFAVADLFSDALHLPPSAARQVRDRIVHHVLIVKDELSSGRFAFDHEEFYHYFLGVAFANLYEAKEHAEVITQIRRGPLPKLSCEVAASRLFEAGIAREASDALTSGLKSETAMSVARENAGHLLAQMLAHDSSGAASQLKGLEIGSVFFPAGILSLKKIARVAFRDCYFGSFKIGPNCLQAVKFENCKFESIGVIKNASVGTASLKGCFVRCAYIDNQDSSVFDPLAVTQVLTRAGFAVVDASGDPSPAVAALEIDERIQLTEKCSRPFTRALEVNELVLRQRMGVKASMFFDEVLPELLERGLMREAEYRGQGNQKRFRLMVQMDEIQQATSKSGGSWSAFLEDLETYLSG